MDNNVQEKKEKKSGKLILVLFIIFLLICIFCFKDRRFLAGIIALIQATIFGAAWCMKKNIIKVVNPAFHTMAVLIGLVLIVPLVMVMDKKPLNKFDWPQSGLATRLPVPKSNKGEIHTNSDDRLWVEVFKTAQNQYEEYLQKCKDMGYVVDSDTSWGYKAYDDEGYKLSLSYVDTQDEMSIELEAPVQYSAFDWPKSEIAMLLPKPKSNIGKVEYDSTDRFSVYVSNTSRDDFNEYINSCSSKGFSVGYNKSDTRYTAENGDGYKIEVEYIGNKTMLIKIDKPDEEEIETEKEPEVVSSTETEKDSMDDTVSENDDSAESNDNIDETSVAEKVANNLIRDEIKEAIDSYEAFVDEYCKFMENYDTSDLSSIAKYTDLLSKEVEMSQKFEDIEDMELSDAEELYYSEVSIRCLKKMSEAASKIN